MSSRDAGRQHTDTSVRNSDARLRWIVERTFAWLGRWRRTSKDYEGTIASSEAFVKLAMVHLMAR